MSTLSTVVYDYRVTMENDTILEISGYCDRDSLNYFSLENILFKNKLSELQKLRNELKDSLMKAI